MKNKFLLITIILGIIILSSINIMAMMPKCTHRYIWEESLSEPIGGVGWYSACMKYKGFCYAGTVLDDVTVITYYTNKGLYGLTHSPQFCATMINNVAKVPGADYSDPTTIEKYRAIAIGACMHQPADIASHSRQNKYGTGEDGLVAYTIKHSLLVNEIIHVFAEQRVDNILCSQYPELEKATEKDLEENYKFAQPLFEMSMLGLDSSISKQQLDDLFDTFIQETLNYQGYKPAYDQKSFLGTFNVIPTSYLAIFLILLSGTVLINVLLVLKIWKKEAKIRHFIGLIFFIFIFSIFIYVGVGAVQGNAFNNFLNLINPVTSIVPIGNYQTYINLGIANTRAMLFEGEGWLDNTDASGRGQIDVLGEANAQVMVWDIIILLVLVVAIIVFIWFLFKKNKIITRNGRLHWNL